MVDASPSIRGTVGELIGSHNGEPVTVELSVRSLAPFGTRSTLERLVDRLERLAETGVVDSLTVDVWGDSLPLDAVRDGAKHGDVVDRLVDLFAFAAESPCSIRRYFHVTSDGTLVDADANRRIVPPRRCLSVRLGGELVGVFPCDVGTEHLTPADAVGYLESFANERSLARATGD